MLLRYKSPRISLKRYSGGRLNIVAEIVVTLSQGTHSTEAMVFVQKDAPCDLLLGTDVMSALGLSLKFDRCEVANPCEEEMVPSGQLQSEESVNKVEGEEESAVGDSGSASPTGVVKLIQAVKIPARHKKMVTVKAEGWRHKDLSLLMPKIEDPTLVMADAVVQFEEGNSAVVIVENHSFSPLRLKKGMVLGELELVEEACDENSVSAVLPATTPAEDVDETVRQERLMEQLTLSQDHLSDVENQQLKDLVAEYSDVFALDSSELGTTDIVTHVINTGEHSPICQPMRRTPFALRSTVNNMVDEMLGEGVIQPSKSPWASPVVLVKKKDGGMRFCIDYRQLNQLTKLDVYPLPRIDDTLSQLSGAKYYTTLDLASGYWQVAMEPASQEKTAFRTYSGLYEFRKMPFGLVNAPATFQRLMEVVLARLIGECCFVYIDDLIVFGRTLEEHNANLRKVFKRLREACLRLKPRKCSFAQLEAEYLGHIVSAAGIRADPRKLVAVKEFPHPETVKMLRSFLGLASYYRRFISAFAKVAAPLHALTKKGVEFVWDEACEEAFTKLKTLLTRAPVLAYPNFEVPFILETDASAAGLGAVLAQKQPDESIRPIAYASRTLVPHEKRYGVTEMEGLGVVWAVKHFRPFLYGHRCELYTDHQALKSLLNTPQPSGKLARWGMAIQELDIHIHHRPGKHNENADALSRYPTQQPMSDDEQDGIVAVLEPEPPMEELGSLQRKDPELNEVIVFLESGMLPQDEKRAKLIALSQAQFTLEEDILYRVEPDGTLRVIPPAGMRENLFQTAHGGVFGAHLRDAKVYSELRKHFWWPSMRKDITNWSRGCLTCATYSTGKAVYPPLTPIPVAGPFDRIGVDVIQFPRSSSGNQYAIVFMDYLTKWPEVFPSPDQTAATIAKLLVEEIVSRHGVPSEVLSDRGKAFLSGLMSEVQGLLGTHRVNTTAYHPQTDGLVERFNRTLTTMLAKTTEQGGRDWDQHIPFVLFAYRASEQESTKESPFFLLYGRDPRLPVDAALCPKQAQKQLSLKEYGVELVRKLGSAWESARTCVKRAQKNQKAYYDRKSRNSNFMVGERVFLFKPAEKTGENRKLARPYHGPYRIVDVTSNNASLCRVDRPHEEPVLVALSRLRRCPSEVKNVFWPPDKGKPRRSNKKSSESTSMALEPVEDESLFTDLNLPDLFDPPVSSDKLKPTTNPTKSSKPSKRSQNTSQKNTWEGRLRSR